MSNALRALPDAIRDLRVLLRQLDQQVANLTHTTPVLPPLDDAPLVPTLHVGDTVWVRVYDRTSWDSQWRLGRLDALEHVAATGETVGLRVDAVATTSPFLAHVVSLDPGAFAIWAFGSDVRAETDDLPSDEALDARQAWEHLS